MHENGDCRRRIFGPQAHHLGQFIVAVTAPLQVEARHAAGTPNAVTTHAEAAGLGLSHHEDRKSLAGEVPVGKTLDSQRVIDAVESDGRTSVDSVHDERGRLRQCAIEGLVRFGHGIRPGAGPP